MADEGKAGDIVYPEFDKEFGTVYHSIHMAKLKSRLGKCRVGLTEKLFNCQSERISSKKYSWGPVDYPGVTAGTDYLDKGTKHTPSKCTDDTELGEVTYMPGCCAAIQKDFCSLENWAIRILLKFNREMQNPASGEEE